MDLIRFSKNVIHYRSFSAERINRIRNAEWAELTSKSSGPILARTREGFEMFVDSRDNAISRSIWVRGTYFQEGVTKVFKSLLGRSSRVVDVGANIGWFTLLAAKRARFVLAFEPDPISSALLRDSLRLNSFRNVEVSEVCVSDSEGKVILWESDTFNGDNSIVRRTGREGVQVRSVTLDESFQGESIDILKVDVQGAEPLVFKGAKRAIEERRIRNVVLEWDPGAWGPESRDLLVAFDAYDLHGQVLSQMPDQKADVLLRIRT